MTEKKITPQQQHEIRYNVQQFFIRGVPEHLQLFQLFSLQ